MDKCHLVTYQRDVHVGTDLAVICWTSIPTASGKKLESSAKALPSGKKIVPNHDKEKFNFAGNMLEVSKRWRRENLQVMFKQLWIAECKDRFN